MCIVFKDPEERIYPLEGIYSKECLPYIKEMIDNNYYRLTSLVNRANGKLKSKMLRKISIL